MPWLVLALVVSYLVGGIPTAIIFSKALRGIDVREYGSRNAGATNVWRVLGAGPAITVLLIDGAKGVVAVLLVSRIANISTDLAINVDTVSVLCGLLAIIGHIWTPYARFKGGKGVGTAAGAFGALAPLAAISALLVFVVVVWLTRYISAGSMSAAVALPGIMITQYLTTPGVVSPVSVVVASAVGLIVIAKHRTNIVRIVRGTENRFGKPATASPSEGESAGAAR
jgi:acyl phosphate:glycerol-3-phosphate acyltransferase